MHSKMKDMFQGNVTLHSLNLVHQELLGERPASNDSVELGAQAFAPINHEWPISGCATGCQHLECQLLQYVKGKNSLTEFSFK